MRPALTTSASLLVILFAQVQCERTARSAVHSSSGLDTSLPLGAVQLQQPRLVSSLRRHSSEQSANELVQLRGGQSATPVSAGGPPSRPKRAPKEEPAAATDELAAIPVMRPNLLVIEAGAADQESSTAVMNPSKVEELGLMAGDIVRLKGKRDREALCIVEESKKVAEGAVLLAPVTRTNLMLGLGDSTKAYRCDDVKHATRAVILPFADAMGGLTADEIHTDLLVPHFMGADGDEAPYRPVMEGDLVRLKHGAQIVECKVIETDPPRRCIISPDTELELPERELDRHEEEVTSPPRPLACRTSRLLALSPPRMPYLSPAAHLAPAARL